MQAKADQYWIVFDKDDTTQEDFVKAVRLAEENEIRVAWSNQAFECWIIMHFRKLNHACHRDSYENILRDHIPGYSASEKGEKQGRKLKKMTFPFLQTAIDNAKMGFESFEPGVSVSKMESSTRVFELIEKILEELI